MSGPSLRGGMDATDVTVEAVRDVGPDTVALDLSTPDGFDALPGQFVLFRVTVDGEEYTRYYTVSSPTVAETFEVTVGIDPEGDLSPWLADLEPGDAITIGGPFGDVHYEGADAGDVVLVGGGPGIGPAIGMAERALADGLEATVVYRDDAPVHEDRLSALAAGGATVTVLSDDESLEAAIAAAVDDGQFYVFGFKPFVEATLAAIEAAGGDPDAAKVESFG